MADVLNPTLYGRLRRHFGAVKIANQGEAIAMDAARDARNAPRLAIRHAGEYYLINCPYCRDTKFRLYVNHMYAQRDAFGRRMTFLAVCFNETACMSVRDHQLDFYETLSEMESEIDDARIKPGVEVAEEAREVAWPGPCTPLQDLPRRHPARAYLEERSFDPDRIGRFYGAAFCHDSHYYMARERLIIPVYERGVLKGWQARYLGELAWKDKTKPLPPKYFTLPGMPRRVLLYNLDKARQYRTAVIVEGPTDVWGFGPMAVCTFGSTMTDAQRRKFLAVFRRRTAVLLYDPDVYRTTAAEGLRDYLSRKMAGQFAAVKLPPGTDPGSLDRDFLRDYVADRAARRGVAVDYRKVEERK